MNKKRKFPRDVARFFHVEKSLLSSGIHQSEKNRERSYIPVKVMNPSVRSFARNNKNSI